MSASDRFRAPIVYPPGTKAVTPDHVQPAACDHEADPPICVCVHDWRIEFGNVPKGGPRTAVL